MPWDVKQDDRCPASKPWGVVKQADGSLEGCHATKTKAKAHQAALYANEPSASSLADRQGVNLHEVREFVHECDGELRRFFPFTVEEVRDSGDAKSAYNMRGYASVYDSWSLDLGGFRERILPGAFDEVVSREPPAHVVHVWDHDNQRVLSSTENRTLTLSVDTHGLQYYSRVAKTSYAADLRVLLERGDISQSSFAFTTAEDDWRVVETEDGEIVERDVIKVANLYDVTTTAMGAYPATTSAVALRSLVSGRQIAGAVVVTPDAGDGKADASVAPEVTPQAEDEAAEEREADQAERAQALAELKDDVANRQRRIREMVNRIDRS